MTEQSGKLSEDMTWEREVYGGVDGYTLTDLVGEMFWRMTPAEVRALAEVIAPEPTAPDWDAYHEGYQNALRDPRAPEPRRITDAMAALARYDAACAEPDDDPGYHKRIDAALDCIEPFRAALTAALEAEKEGRA